MPLRGSLLDAAHLGRFTHADPKTPRWRWESNPAREGEAYSQQDKVLNTTTGVGFGGIKIKEVLFGGAPGGGKTYLLIAMAYIHVLEYGPLAFVGMFRRETPEFRDILRQARLMYVPLGGRWNDRDRIWTFPNGGVIQMTYCRNMEDALAHKGAAYSLLLWDELTGWHDDGPYEFLLTRLRTVEKGLFPQSVATCNPDGPGMWWVRERWRIMDTTHKHEEPFLGEMTPDTPEHIQPHHCVFIPSLLTDNPHFDGTGYEESLWSIKDPARRNAYLNGDWSSFVGQAYPEFDEKLHVCSAFTPPPSWPRWASIDWGTSSPYCVLYFAHDAQTGHTYVMRETYGHDVNLKNSGLGRAAREVAREEWQVRAQLYGPQLAAIDPETYSNRGHETTIAQDWINAGWPCEQGNRNRRTRGEVIRSAMQNILPDGRPELQITEQCVHLIRTIQVLVMDPDKPEQVLDGGEDHPWDTLGYGLCSTVATAHQAMLGLGHRNGASAGPDPRNVNYEPNRDWNAPAGLPKPDEGREAFELSMIGRLSGRN